MPRLRTKEILYYLALGLLALIVRVWELDRHILLIDEAFVGVAARDIAFNDTPMWEAVSNAPYVWGLAQFIQLLGDSPFVLRLPSALAGVLTCLLLYWFVKKRIGQTEALLTSVLFALHPFSVAFTRVAFVDALQLPMLLLCLLAIDEYLEKRSGYTWAIVGVIAAMLAFIGKYNALAVLACWFFAAIAVRRYSIIKAVLWGSVLAAASLATLLLWPYDATVWFFSFLAKGGTYDRGYIWGFYHYAYRHVTFGSITLFIALAAYLAVRPQYIQKQRGLLDHIILFGLFYFGLLLYLGRPFQRYFLLLTVPVAVIYAVCLVQGIKSWSERNTSLTIRWLHVSLCGALALGILIQSYNSTRGYVRYLNNDLPLEQAIGDLPLPDTTRVFWPTLSASIGAYYLGFDQYYSMSTRGAIDKKSMDRHFFLASPLPYSADTLPYSVLTAKRELQDRGFFSSVFHPRDFLNSVRAKDVEVDKMRNAIVPLDYYNTELVRPGDLLIETKGTIDQNGEPMLYLIEDTVRNPDPIPAGFELVKAYVGDREYTSLPYPVTIGKGEVRVLRKRHAAR